MDNIYKEDVNDLLIHPRAFTTLIKQVNQDIGGILYKPPSRLAALGTVLRAIYERLCNRRIVAFGMPYEAIWGYDSDKTRKMSYAFFNAFLRFPHRNRAVWSHAPDNQL